MFILSCKTVLTDWEMKYFCLFGSYLTRELIWQSSIRPSKMVYLLFEIFERAGVSLLMLSAKQGNHWYHFLTSLVWRGPLSGIEPLTSHTRSEHSTARISGQLMEQEIIHNTMAGLSVDHQKVKEEPYAWKDINVAYSIKVHIKAKNNTNFLNSSFIYSPICKQVLM